VTSLTAYVFEALDEDLRIPSMSELAKRVTPEGIENEIDKSLRALEYPVAPTFVPRSPLAVRVRSKPPPPYHRREWSMPEYGGVTMYQDNTQSSRQL
jgi:hypothetical protein